MDAWDTIIVGAGSAGCVLAHRLSADPSHRVLLLEAGGTDRRFWVRGPIGYARTFRDPAVNWMLQTEPEPALGGRSSYWPRGRLLGGSGSINAMAYVRGQPADFDGWAQQGNPGWSWHDVLPFFLAAEDNAAGASALHGGGGPMRVTDIADLVHPLCDSFFAAASPLGLGRTNDLNGAQGSGYKRPANRHDIPVRHYRSPWTRRENALRRANSIRRSPSIVPAICAPELRNFDKHRSSKVVLPFV